MKMLSVAGLYVRHCVAECIMMQPANYCHVFICLASVFDFMQFLHFYYSCYSSLVAVNLATY